MPDKLQVSCSCGWEHEGTEEHAVAHALMDHAGKHHGTSLSHEKAHQMVRDQNKK